MGRRCATTFVLVGLVVALAAPVAAEQVTLPDRESSYPAGVANVSHAPWTPRQGQDVVVTLRLDDDARVPDAVSLLFCRVEPDYVCGLPFFLDQANGGRTWRGTIAWDYGLDASGTRFITDETVHLGYNVTMRFQEPDTPVERVSAPTGNFWVPETYPADSDGVYYFLSYERAEASALPGPAPAAVLVVLAALALVARRHRLDA